MLAERTALEPGEPIGVDLEKDELVFFPLIYWPIGRRAEPLPDRRWRRIDAYMRQGGTILFDTRDQQIADLDTLHRRRRPASAGAGMLSASSTSRRSSRCRPTMC